MAVRAREDQRDPRAAWPIRDRAGRARAIPEPRVLRAPTRLLQYVRRQGEKVTAAQIKQSAAKHLKPCQAVYLVVGNGDEKMIVDNPKAAKGSLPKNRKLPYEKDGKQVTLREALAELAKKGDVGPGALVELDVDGRPVK